MKNSYFETPRMVKLKIAAAEFGLSYYALRRLVLSGEVPAIRLGGAESRGTILVNLDALAAYLNSAKIKPEPAPAAVHGIRVLH